METQGYFFFTAMSKQVEMENTMVFYLGDCVAI